MSPGNVQPIPLEIIKTLAQVVEQALAPRAVAVDLKVARDVAQVLGLDGLDRALRACRQGTGDNRDALADLVRSIARQADEVGSLAMVAEADPELARLAAEITPGHESDSVSEGRADSTLSVADALDDFPLADDRSRELARSVRLSAPVTAALRATMDWLQPEHSLFRPVLLSAEDSSIAVTCGPVNYAGLRPAHAVLGAVDGNLGPSLIGDPEASAPGTWTLRVPTISQRNTFLMVVQGDLKLAIPWHSVLRLRMVPSDDMEAIYSRLEYPVVAPLAPVARAASELPVILVGHGLKRAYVIADRLIWRLPASVGSRSDRGHRCLTRMAFTDDAEAFHLVDLALLLEAVDLPPLPVLAALDTPVTSTRISEPEAQDVTTHPQSDEAHAQTSHSFVAPEESEIALLDLETVLEATDFTAGLEADAASQLQDLAEVMDLQALAGGDEASANDILEATPTLETPGRVEEGESVPTEEKELAADLLSDEPTSDVRTTLDIDAADADIHGEDPAALESESPEAELTSAGEEIDTSDPAAVFRNPHAQVHSRVAGPSGAHSTHEATLEPLSADRVKPLSLQALVAEDSLTARLFLTRLLEQQGFRVHAVTSAAELFRQLNTQAWSMICVDVDLPDSRGVEFLRTLMGRHRESQPDTSLVALVRDPADVVAANAAGVWMTLRKPIEREALEAMLDRVGLAPRKKS